MAKLAVVLVLGLACAGCTTMSAEECRAANWSELGFRDGLGGLQRMDNLYEHQCAQHGIGMDLPAYYLGWREGRWEYEYRYSHGGSIDSE